MCDPDEENDPKATKKLRPYMVEVRGTAPDVRKELIQRKSVEIRWKFAEKPPKNHLKIDRENLFFIGISAKFLRRRHLVETLSTH